MTNTRRHRSLLLWLAEWIVLSTLWFLLEGTVSWVEAIAGCTTAALITVITAKVLNQHFVAFQPRLQWLGLVWRLPIKVLRDSVIVLVALGQWLQGQEVSGAFKRLSLPDAGANSRAAAWRARGSCPAGDGVRVCGLGSRRSSENGW